MYTYKHGKDGLPLFRQHTHTQTHLYIYIDIHLQVDPCMSPIISPGPPGNIFRFPPWRKARMRPDLLWWQAPGFGLNATAFMLHTFRESYWLPTHFSRRNAAGGWHSEQRNWWSRLCKSWAGHCLLTGSWLTGLKCRCPCPIHTGACGHSWCRQIPWHN